MTYILRNMNKFRIVLHVGRLLLILVQLRRTLTIGFVFGIESISIRKGHKQSFVMILSLFQNRINIPKNSRKVDLEESVHRIGITNRNEVGALCMAGWSEDKEN